MWRRRDGPNAPQFVAGSGQSPRHRTDGTAEQSGRFRVRHPLQIAENERLAKRAGQLAQLFIQQGLKLTPLNVVCG